MIFITFAYFVVLPLTYVKSINSTSLGNCITSLFL